MKTRVMTVCVIGLAFVLFAGCGESDDDERPVRSEQPAGQAPSGPGTTAPGSPGAPQSGSGR